MNNHFYSHLIETSQLSLELGNMQLHASERLELISLVQSNIHHTILSVILDQLGEEDKKQFLHLVTKNDHKKTWELLRTKTNNIEDSIKDAAEKLKKEFLSDIKKAHTAK